MMSNGGSLQKNRGAGTVRDASHVADSPTQTFLTGGFVESSCHSLLNLFLGP